MSFFKYMLVNILETALRVLPLSCRTGLITIGNPDRNSPVLLTCNYHLTVERVIRASQEIDAYLLVGDSKGINVWCAATGGLLTNHGVISVLKTSGIEELVDHRNVILPQLAATGVEARVVRKKTGWKVVWGPVYARDIPFFIKCGLKKTLKMRAVEFSRAQRVEMAVAWAFPISIIAALILISLWPEVVCPLILLIWGLSFLIFMSFPLYGERLRPRGRRFGLVLFDFGRGGVQIILWGLLVVGLTAYRILFGDFTWGFMVGWGLISLVLVLLLSLDLMGSTPVLKSGLHDDSLLTVTIDKNKCKGAGLCEQVCPRNCYEVDTHGQMAKMPRAERCVQCGACIIQCPFDALYFRTPKDEIVPPETIRRFKLSLLGKRLVRVEGGTRPGDHERTL